MAKKNTARIDDGIIDCACVIHSDGYSWQYVDVLYNMLQRQLDRPFRFHVYTEADRPVPEHMIKHALTPWSGISGHRKSWWYKLQLFNPEHVNTNMLYFDLDLVLIRPVTWIVEQDPNYFWSVRDFRYLQGQKTYTVNSSVMWFNVPKFSHVWDQIKNTDMLTLSRRYHGDQDFIDATIDRPSKRFFPETHVQSYRWECLDGGYDFRRRCYHQPGAGIGVNDDASIIAFHGQPKPHQVQDPVVQKFWC